MLLCQNIHAATEKSGDSPVVQLMDTNEKAKKVEGAMLKMARPILKKTPMSAVMDNIEMMIICSVDNADDKVFVEKAENVLKGYNKVNEIHDDDYTMFIYINDPEGKEFSEIILYKTTPDASIMVFEGNFNAEGLMKVGELSDQQRQKRKQSKKAGTDL